MQQDTPPPGRGLRARFLAPLAIAGFAVTALASGPALAAPPSDQDRSERDGICERLQCTEDQRKELAEIRRELRADLKKDREALEELQRQLAAEFAKDKPDEKKMKRLYAQIDQRRANIRDRGHDAMMEVHAVLTPAQRQKVAKAMAQHGPRALLRGQGKGKGKGGKGKQRSAAD